MNPRDINNWQLCLYGFRSLLFYIGYILSAVIFTPFVLCTVIAPYEFRSWFINRWCWFALFWLGITCKINVKISCNYDYKNLPATVVLSNHQSTWETLFLQLQFSPATPVVKKELLSIPFFGWGLRLLQPISIDRKNPRQAGKNFLQQGQIAIEKNRWVILYPEGTRVAIGDKKPLSLGGFRLASSTGTPILPVCHNAGYFWPARKFIKFPGTIECIIGDPIDSGDKPMYLQEIYENQLELMGNAMKSQLH